MQLQLSVGYVFMCSASLACLVIETPKAQGVVSVCSKLLAAASSCQSRTRYMNAKSSYEQGSTRPAFERFRLFGVLPLRLLSARHSCSWSLAVQDSVCLGFRHASSPLSGGAYEALQELTAFSTQSMRNATDNGALCGLQSIKNLLASG